MDSSFLLNFINVLLVTFQVLIVIRVLLSWFRPEPTGSAGRFLVDVTDPILAPFQKVLPPMAGLDFSPILALVSLQILQNLANNVLG